MPEATQEGASTAEKLMARWSEEPAEQEEQEEVETEEVETQAAETEEGGEEAEATEESEAREYDLSDIASVLGYDESDLAIDEDGQVKIKVKVDGEERLATPAELRKSYQLEGHLNKNNMEVTEQRKALQAKEQELTQQYQERLAQAHNYGQLAYQELTREYQNLEKLRETDPHEWVIQKANLDDRHARITYALQQTQEQQKAQAQQFRDAEYQRLIEAVPEWKDSEVFRADSKKLIGTAKDYGISEKEMNGISDHRFLLVFRDAQRYREQQNKKPEVLKKVKAAPKVVKAGQPVSKQSIDEKKVATLKKKAQSGERGAVAGLLLERWGKKQ